MKDAYSSMVESLEPLSLYDFSKDYISTELSTYAYMIDELNLYLCEMLSESFLDTACMYGLENRELIIGAVRDDLSILKRREMLKLRESIDQSSFTVEKIKNSLKSFGLECEVYEYPSLYTVVVDADGTYSQHQKAWIRSQVEKIMPAHLVVQVAFGGVSWNYSDEKDSTFSDIDSKDYLWNQIDNFE